MNYFFEIGTTLSLLDYLKEVERQLRKLRKKHRYKVMIEMVRAEENNPLFKEKGKSSTPVLAQRNIHI